MGSSIGLHLHPRSGSGLGIHWFHVATVRAQPGSGSWFVDRTRPPKDGRLPSPGTLLTRRVGDRQIVVKVLADGFEYESRRYRSLSAIAREATGTRWNGLLFFGLTERRDA